MMQFYGSNLVKLFSTLIPFSTKAKFNYKVLKSVVENLAFYKQSVSFIVVNSKIDGAVGGGGVVTADVGHLTFSEMALF